MLKFMYVLKSRTKFFPPVERQMWSPRSFYHHLNGFSSIPRMVNKDQYTICTLVYNVSISSILWSRFTKRKSTEIPKMEDKRIFHFRSIISRNSYIFCITYFNKKKAWWNDYIQKPAPSKCNWLKLVILEPKM